MQGGGHYTAQLRGEAEINDLHLSGQRVPEDIGRIEVLVDDPLLMDAVKAFRDLYSQGQAARYIRPDRMR